MKTKDLTGYRVLAVHAHPDDEVLFTGGTLADMAARGADVAVVQACTLEDERLFSHRRAPGQGRFAGLVWRADEDASTPTGAA